MVFGSWPCTSACQEKVAGLLALTWSSVLAASVSGHTILSSVILPDCTPSSPNCSARTTPRRLGSAARHLHQPLCLRHHRSSAARAARPFRTKAVLREERAALRLLDRDEEVLLRRRASPPVRRSLPRPAPGSALRSRPRDVELREGFLESHSRCRPGLLVESSWLMSVVIEKWVAAYQLDTTVSRIAPAITQRG